MPRRRMGDLFRQYFQYGFWKTIVIRKRRRVDSWRHLVPALTVLGLAGSLSLALFCEDCRALALVPGLVYLAFIAAGSFFAGKRRGWRVHLCIMPVIICFHFAYGIGFLCGVLGRGRPTKTRLASGMTR